MVRSVAAGAPAPSSRPPKVVHVVVAGEIGGAEHVLVDLATRPDQSGAEHCLALMTPNPALRAFFADAGLHIRDRGPVRENPLAYLWRSLGPADIAWLGGVLRDEGASLLHAHTYGSHVLAARAARRHGVPLVRTEHGVRHYRDPSCAPFRHWALRRTDRIVAVSDFVGRTVAAIAPHVQDRIQVIANGIDIARFQAAPPPASGAFTFCMVSRLAPIKRIALAIEAVARTPGVRLDIAGDGIQRDALHSLARKLGIADRVRFLGHLADPRPVIAGSDAIINCTREEALSLSIIEAAAMQRPAVAFDDGGTPEIVQDGRTGWLVRDHSVAGLAQALAEAAANRARTAELGAAACAWVKDRFDIATMCHSYGSVYRGLCAAAPVPHAALPASHGEACIADSGLPN